MRTVPSQAGSPGSGFTLIELLVVIAIISLLLAILVPSLGAARNMARLVVCLTQTRSQGTAWMMYLEDSKGNFPTWKSNMQWLYGGKEPCVYTANALNFRPLNPYVDRAMQNVSSAEIFRCPSDRPIEGITQGLSAYDYVGNSYMMNWMLLGKVDMDAWAKGIGQYKVRNPIPPPPETQFYSVNLSDIQTPLTKTVMLGDCQWYYAINKAKYDAAFHNKENRVNLVFCDGHAGTTQIVPELDPSPDYNYALYPYPP